MINVPDHVENPEAYIEAAKRRIQANARKGRMDRWLADRPDREALIVTLQQAAPGSFLAKMYDAVEEWGSLTEGQERAVRESIAKAEARKAEFRARDAGSQHVGEIGKRQDFTLTVRTIIEIENDFGLLVITIFADEAGNVVVYKGQKLGRSVPQSFAPLQKGDTVTMKATVKAHTERDGVKQTIVNRPKLN